jgi:hypothetical protein
MSLPISGPFTITITAPANGTELDSPSQGQAIIIAGKVTGYQTIINPKTGPQRIPAPAPGITVNVRLEGDAVISPQTAQDTTNNAGIWECSLQATRPGAAKFTASCANGVASASISVIILDKEPPQSPQVIVPLENESIRIPDYELAKVEIKVKATDFLGVSQVEIEGECITENNWKPIIFPSYNGTDWVGELLLPTVKPRNYTLRVKAFDFASPTKNVSSVETRNFQTIDTNPPRFNIASPKDGDIIPNNADVIVCGWADDPQTGIAKLEWKLDSGAWQSAPQNNWSSWSFTIPKATLKPGKHAVEIRLWDNAGNSSQPTADAITTFEVAESYEPQDVNDLVSLQAYLKDLLNFSCHHINTQVPSLGAQLSTTDLSNILYQPFSLLGDARISISGLPINQVRGCVEVLRKYLGSNHLDEGLIAAWSFDEGKGNVASDISGEYLAALTNGPTWKSGKIKGGLSFDGVDNYVEVQNSNVFAATDSLSVCAWIYPTSSGSGNNGEGGIILNKEGEYEVARFADGSIRWAFANEQPAWNWVNTNYIAPLNQWTHLAIIYNSGNIRSYANGQIVHTYEGKGSIKSSESSSLRIGGREHTSQHFQGIIDEVRIYRIAISPWIITQLAGQNLSNPDLAAHWKFDEGSGSEISDTSVNRYKGTLNGPVWKAGRSGSTLYFDGKDDRVTINADQKLRDITNNFTITFWAFPDQDLTAKISVVLEQPNGISGTTGQHYALSPLQGRSAFGSTDSVGVGISVGWNGVQVFEHSEAYLPALLAYVDNGNPDSKLIATWTHIAVVYQNSEPRLYINGNLVKTGLKSKKQYIHVLPEAIGGGEYGFYQGFMDDIRIYQGILSDDEIAALAHTRIASSLPLPDAVTEADYRLTAYEGLLQQIGTSYSELRLIHGAQDTAQKALAERLGIDLSSDPARLEKLLLTSNTLNEAQLEQLFGLVNSTRDPLEPSNVPLLLQWQRERLESLWREEDKTTPTPIIDPDLISQADLSRPTAGNPTFDLWSSRLAWIKYKYEYFKQICSSYPSAKEIFVVLISDGLGLSEAEFEKLINRSKEGIDLTQRLEDLGLTTAALQCLMSVYQLTGTGIVTQDEWQDIIHILVQAQKLRRYSEWHKEEQDHQPPITLNPKEFVVGAVRPGLQMWRASLAQRRHWEEILQARSTQWQSLDDSLQAAIATTEEQSLPILRDAIISQIATQLGLHPDDTRKWLTRRLLIDVEGSGTQRTTRLLQAIQTVQGILFSLQTGQLPAGHPARGWKLAYVTKNETGNPCIQECSDAHFAEEWKWIGSYDAWRGAMLMFFFPENLLLPGLRDPRDMTLAFQMLIRELRSQQRLNPQVAREIASRYQEQASSLVLLLGLDSFDSISNTVPDLSGNQNSIKITSANPHIDSATGALSFDGNTQLIVSHQTDLEVGRNNSDFSVSFSIYLKEGPTDSGRSRPLLCNGETKDERTFAIFLHSDTNRICYRISTRSNNNNDGGDSNAEISLNTWVNVEYRKQKNYLQLYLNGTLDSEIELKDVTIASQGSLYLGKDPLADCESAQCVLKNLQIYNYAISSRQLSLTDQYTEDDLKDIRNRCKQAIQPILDRKSSIPSPLQEIFYFAPMEVALQLQKSREYTAALRWFARVYAYYWPENSRKIYLPLEQEKNYAPSLHRGEHWLIDSLNPHKLANLRQTDPGLNSYCRFTLMSLARCFIEHGDNEFTTDTGESLTRARSLYLTAQALLSLPDLDPPIVLPPPQPQNQVLPNPILEILRQRVEAQLVKLRQGRNIAGMKRQIEIPVPRSVAGDLPTIGPEGQLVIPGARPILHPTPYRYAVLIERSKQLINIAQQMEANFLATLEKRDKESYDLLQAGYSLQVAREGEVLQQRRFEETQENTALARLQQDRVKLLQDTYQQWIDAGLNEFENQMIDAYTRSAIARTCATFFGTLAQIAQAQTTAAAGGATGAAAAAVPAAVTAVMAMGGYMASSIAITAETQAQIASINASQERRKQEWQLQKNLADKDKLITDKQVDIALDHEQIAKQEQQIAKIQVAQANAVAQYLARKFTNAELYDWMSRILGEVYSYFLQQATVIAQLAQSQLSFERQEIAPAFIQADYWQSPSEVGEGKSPDRQGLTGSARLLEDIHKLDQYAFETNKRKLNLSQTFSLSQLFPYEFLLFRETGVLPFKTPMRLFDEGFPGHYLRLIKQVRTSVVALIPPNQGIRATLTASGISRTVTGGDLFQEVIIRRDPELVALTSPTNANGVFELDTQSEMLLPFETMGVDTTWEFQMPRPANPFDFRTIADVLITIDYTALHSFDYRQQVIRTLDTSVSCDRTFSIRNDFPDFWYELNNLDQSSNSFEIHFNTERTDFPSNLVGDITLQELLFYVQTREGDQPVSGKVELTLTSNQIGAIGPLSAQLNESLISTRRTSGNSTWGLGIRSKSAIASWHFKLSDDPTSAETRLNDHFRNGEIEDILIVLTFSGRKPAWP